MPATQTVEHPNFDTVWAVLQEVAERQKENERYLKESAEDFNRRIGHLDNLFGEIAEHTIAPNLREKFAEIGLVFPRANRNADVKDYVNNIFLEIDVLLENGDKAMLVEVKNRLTIDRINNHIERLTKMRTYANLHGDKRIFLGAVAGVIVPDDAKTYAFEQGLYLVEPSGESFSITPPSGKPKEW